MGKAAAKREHARQAAAFLATITAAILLVLVAAAEPAQAAFPGTNGKIAFYRDGDVWTINPNGTGATKLTTNYNAEANPAVSPDGSRIAYEFLRGVWVMNVDGSGQIKLTNGGSTDEDPTWSPDGTRIAFSRNADVWAVNADGSGQRNLTRTPDIEEFDPSWSPKGDRIAYTSGCVPGGGGACVFTMNADGSGKTNLTPEDSLPECPDSPGYYHDGASRQPAWSPDGQRIAFTGALICPHTLGKDIWTMNALDGSGKTNLINDEGTNDLRPAFSPDGSKIVFESDRGNDSGRTELYVMNSTDGSGLKRLSAADDRGNDADWGVTRPTCSRTGTTGNDTLNGTPGRDVICGLGGNDRINGLGGDDLLLGDGGDDTLVGASGRDTLNGGAGTDTASFAGSATGVNASLTTGFARRTGTNPPEGVALVGMENLAGSSLDDSLAGSAGTNILAGGGGADTLLGLGGNDTLNSRDGVNGNDSLDGGAGTDRCTTDAREASVRNCE